MFQIVELIFDSYIDVHSSKCKGNMVKQDRPPHENIWKCC